MSALDLSGVLQPGDAVLPQAVATASGLRTALAVELREDLRTSLHRHGITRVAHLTGFDRLGIPVHMAVKPQGRSLSSGSGKGMDADSSWVSAVMEAIEQSIWESLDPSDVCASMAAMARLGCPTVNGDDLPSYEGGVFTPSTPIGWRAGWDLVGGKEVWIPDELVTCGRTLSSPFVQGSNGLASGRHVVEAILSGLIEVVERDGLTLSTLGIPAPEVDLQARLENAAPSVAGRLHEAGVVVRTIDATTDVGVPTVVAFLGDAPGERTGLFKGVGAGCSTAIALVRAVTEAAQSRCVVIAGARDDIFRSQRRASASARIDHVMPDRETPIGNEVDATTGDLVGDLNWVASKLCARGLEQIIVVRHTQPHEEVQVVRVVVPGLEGYPFKKAARKRRALHKLAMARDWS